MRKRKIERREFVLVKVGNDERPAGDADIKHVQRQISKMKKIADSGALPFMVTHHAISFETVSIPK